jgi:hypothetical protein
MTVHPRLASMLLAAALTWLALPSAASAQDVMELDLAFKNGQLGTHASDARRAPAESRRVVTVKKRTWRRRTVSSR